MAGPIKVKGHWRCLPAKPKPKKKKPIERPAPAGPYYVVADDHGRTCRHYHRTRAGARRCANAEQRRESVQRARNLTRKQAKRQRVNRWHVVPKNGAR